MRLIELEEVIAPVERLLEQSSKGASTQ